MRIINLKADNIKKLTAIDITPTEDMVMITGKNGAGKSSILDSIEMALCGGRAIPVEPIKKGEKKGKIEVTIGEGKTAQYLVSRSFTKANSYLKIEPLDGKKITSPQKFLDEIVGSVSFDPLDFINNESKKQKDILLGLIGVDVDGINKEENDLRNKRALVGRERDKYEVLLKSLPNHSDITNDREESASSIVIQLEEANDFNKKLSDSWQENEKIKEAAKERIASIALWKEEIVALQEKIDTAEANLATDKDRYQSEKKRLAEIKLIDVQAIKDSLSNVESVNQKIRDNIKYRQVKNDHIAYSKEYDTMTKSIEALVKKREEILTSTEMPITGLSFDDDGLLYYGIPLAQCSDGEKLMISLSISMALNPTLKVLRIKDGSLLDETNRAIIKKTIAEKDYQLWFESVGENGGGSGIVIEDGSIIEVDGKEVNIRNDSKDTSFDKPVKKNDDVYKEIGLGQDPFADWP